MCGNAEGNRAHSAREMMFGTRETFPYVECGACGCVTIAAAPPDLARHYGDDYYSMREDRPGLVRAVRDAVRRIRFAWMHDERTPLGRVGAALLGGPEHWGWLTAAGATVRSRIADVGCGSGALLRQLRREGFRDLTGIDPFVPRSVVEPGLRVLKADMAEVGETFDLVMLNHSLEHIPDQDVAMRKVRALVRPGGTVLVRIPVVAWAWRTYGVDWVQLDAPRHAVLHTERSLRALAERAGFDVVRVVYDSWAFQLWGSEQYRRGVSLHDPRSCDRDPRHPLFSVSEMREFRRKARELNASADGDQACFYLRPR